MRVRALKLYAWNIEKHIGIKRNDVEGLTWRQG